MSAFARAVFITLLAAAPVEAQTATATLSANLGVLARLSLSTNSLSIPDADPDTVPHIPALPSQVTITAKARATERAVVTLTVQAADDLRSGVETIPAAALTWTAAGPGFSAGTVSRLAPQPVASWTGSGVHVGTQSYVFQNSWSYAAGTYTLSLLYTLSSP